jgi:hypothetical protein
MLPRQLKRDHGITAIECIGAEKLRASLDAGHGVMIVSNHCRPCDPMVLDSLAAAVKRPFHVIASWHVFMLGRIQRFLLPRVGGFSIYREGLDRESLKCAVQTIAEARFPLVVFPEGIITRCNDRLASFMEGPAFITRAAAKQAEQGKVVIHPVFIRYFFEGDLAGGLAPVIEEIERRLSWQPQTQLSLGKRISKVGGALLDLKEIEYLQSSQTGSFADRLQRLENHLLSPLEDQWTPGRHNGGSMARVKRLRTAILPDMVGGNLTEEDRASRWRSLADLYLVQQLHCYPGDYLEEPTPERALETVERYEEDLTDSARPHGPMRAVITVGEAIEVGAAREGSRETDPLSLRLRQEMKTLLEVSKAHRRVHPTGTDLI